MNIFVMNPVALGVGDVVRFEPGETRGLRNTGATEFMYVAMTSPPHDFRAAYRGHSGPAARPC